MKNGFIPAMAPALLIAFLLITGCSQTAPDPHVSNATAPEPTAVFTATVPSPSPSLSRIGASGTRVPDDWVPGYDGSLMPPMPPVVASPSDPVSV